MDLMLGDGTMLTQEEVERRSREGPDAGRWRATLEAQGKHPCVLCGCLTRAGILVNRQGAWVGLPLCLPCREMVSRMARVRKGGA